MNGVTQELAQFAANYSQPEVSDYVSEVTGRRFAIFAALAAESANEQSVNSVLEALQEGNDSDQVGILGRNDRLSLVDAPIVTGTSIAISLNQKTSFLDGNWFQAAIVAAALSAGEYRNTKGVDLLLSLVVASEVGLRVESAMSPGILELGWAPSSVASLFGAATVAGRCFGLDAKAFVSVFGLAATQVAGFAVTKSSALGDFAVGKAAGDGTEAAFLSKIGFSGSSAPIEGRRGLLELVTPGRNEKSRITRDLGKVWLVEGLGDQQEVLSELKFQRTFEAGMHLATLTDLSELHQASKEDLKSI